MITIPIAPRQKGRHRSTVVRSGPKSFARHYPDPKSARWEDRVAYFLARCAPPKLIEGPVRMRVLFVMPRPKRLLRRKDPEGLLEGHDKKPDLSNLLKALEDAVNEIWFRDDRQIAEVITAKVWAEKDGQPRIIFALEPMQQAEMTIEDWFSRARVPGLETMA